MDYYGYHRTSTEEQHLDRGITAIKKYCAENQIPLREMFTDQQTGKNFDRPEYQMLKRIAKEGDVIIITEVDRLGRDKEDTIKELHYFKERGVLIRILELPTTLTDYSSMGNDLANMMMETINNMLIEMYATVAHAEMIKRETRQKEGIQAKKGRGEWDDYGRPAMFPTDEAFKAFCDEYKLLASQGNTKAQMIRRMGMKKATFYKYRKIFLEKEFPIMYKKLKNGEISMDDIQSTLGIQDDEYNRHILQSGETKYLKTPNYNDKSQPEADTYNHVTPNILINPQPKAAIITPSEISLYIMAMTGELNKRINIYRHDSEAIELMTEYLNYLPSLETADSTVVDTCKENIAQILEYYPCPGDLSNLETNIYTSATQKQLVAASF